MPPYDIASRHIISRPTERIRMFKVIEGLPPDVLRLVNTVLGTASGARNIGSNGALAVGGYIALAFEWILKGPPTATGTIAAQGTLVRDGGGPHQ
jgi:hypothetical protein